MHTEQHIEEHINKELYEKLCYDVDSLLHNINATNITSPKIETTTNILDDLFMNREELIQNLEPIGDLLDENWKHDAVEENNKILSYNVLEAILDYGWIEELKASNLRYILNSFDSDYLEDDIMLDITIKGYNFLVDPDPKIITKIDDYLKARPGEDSPFDRSFEEDLKCLSEFRNEAREQKGTEHDSDE